jgi:hypothetical protein
MTLAALAASVSPLRGLATFCLCTPGLRRGLTL